MKKSCKKIFSLVLMLLVVMSLTVSAFADTASITFNGFTSGFDFKPGSEYTATDLFENFKNVMPGDVLTQEITFKNAATDSDYVIVYMRAEAHDESANPLSEKVAETETVATMSDFLAQLSMKVWNGTELIYQASPDQLDGLKENVRLGTFRSGETTTLKVELSVPADLGNEYANRVGEVDWVFHVEAYSESQLTVRKVWSDGNANHEYESVTVNLLKDGEVEESVELSAENQWVYTFDRLSEQYTWSVEEVNPPEGYTVSYETVGNTTTIYNAKESPDPRFPLDITVKKVFSNDSTLERPKYVTVTLYNGKTAVETVRLDASNNWTYSWKDLHSYGNWQVMETNIPYGYTPVYTTQGNVVTITNTRRLIQTGQLNWPIWALGAVGITFIAVGISTTMKKKKKCNT